VLYADIPLEGRRRALQQAGILPFLVEALASQVHERLKGRESVVHWETYAALVSPPTSFAQFAQRNAGAFQGESVWAGM
jgi:hypothetical protein